jgi:hypothetical protein
VIVTAAPATTNVARRAAAAIHRRGTNYPNPYNALISGIAIPIKKAPAKAHNIPVLARTARSGRAEWWAKAIVPPPMTAEAPHTARAIHMIHAMIV